MPKRQCNVPVPTGVTTPHDEDACCASSRVIIRIEDLNRLESRRAHDPRMCVFTKPLDGNMTLKSRAKSLLLAALVAVSGVVLAGCGDTAVSDAAAEGEPITIGAVPGWTDQTFNYFSPTIGPVHGGITPQPSLKVYLLRQFEGSQPIED